MTLVEHDGSFCIRVNGQPLMHSLVATSEIKLGTLGCERHSAKDLKPKVLIGGLGLGFTLEGVLQTTGPKAQVDVVELFPEIVDGTGRLWPTLMELHSRTRALKCLRKT